MTAIELNRALQMEVDTLASYEGLTEKVLRYVRSLKRKYDEQFISKEEILNGIREGLEDVKAGRGMSLEEFMHEMDQ